MRLEGIELAICSVVNGKSGSLYKKMSLMTRMRVYVQMARPMRDGGGYRLGKVRRAK